jgi:hypothetical protein
VNKANHCVFCGTKPVLVHFENTLAIRCPETECPATPLVDNFLETQMTEMIMIWNELNNEQTQESRFKDDPKPVSCYEPAPVWCGEIV